MGRLPRTNGAFRLSVFADIQSMADNLYSLSLIPEEPEEGEAPAGNQHELADSVADSQVRLRMHSHQHHVL